jgi:D-ribose pyranase
MYKNGVLNSNVNRVLGELGHTDTVCIGDCGLPVPAGVEKIDLALRQGVPGFWDVFEVVAGSMKVECVTAAEEMVEQNPQLWAKILDFLGADVERRVVPHSQLKEESAGCKAVIRTGEATPFANVILTAACIF